MFLSSSWPWPYGSSARGTACPSSRLFPPPNAVLVSFKDAVLDLAYWGSWANSFRRIALGFILAQIVGVSLGAAHGNQPAYFREMSLPVFEVLRPIPPLAWVSASALFWPTPEMSIVFVTFLGAFFVTILNIVGGARSTRRPLHSGSRLPRVQPDRYLLAHHSSRHLAQYRRGDVGGHRHLLEHGGGGRDARRPFRPGVFDLAGLCDLHPIP